MYIYIYICVCCVQCFFEVRGFVRVSVVTRGLGSSVLGCHSTPPPFPSMMPSPPLPNLRWLIDSQHARTYVPSNWGIDEGMM